MNITNPRTAQYPYWPYGSPQRANSIPGRQSLMRIADLAVNQIPRGRADIIPLHPAPVPRVPGAEGPRGGETRAVGKLGRNLYELFDVTQSMSGEDLARFMAAG